MAAHEASDPVAARKGARPLTWTGLPPHLLSNAQGP